MIIIFCPWGNATGGTELLHQLGYKLNLFGFDAKIYYYGDDNGLPATHQHFIKYGVPVLGTVTDSSENIFIYPEMMVSSLGGIKGQLPQSRHVLWWLSVDNAGMTPNSEQTLSEDKSLIHFVQSYYAKEYVRNVLKVSDDRLFWLSDYLNYDFLNVDVNKKRDDFVLYNPRKGFERTSRLIQKSDSRIKWLALSGFAPEEIPQVLQCAKVYIDFGEHPGKDRFPREAVSCGCRVITGVKGAAANDIDVPIPKKFKIDDDLEDEKILNLIISLIEDYEQTEDLYRDYKKRTQEEFHTFEADTLKVFFELVGKSTDGVYPDKQELKNAIIEVVTNEDYKKALYLITVYRMSNYAIDEDLLILEGYTRMGIREEQAALYLMNELLSLNDTNYEAYLIKACAIASLGMKGKREAIDNALKYSIGTPDEEYIHRVVKMY